MEWLRGLGVSISEPRPFMAYGRGRTVDPAAMTATLGNQVARRGGTIHLRTALVELLTDEGGAVVGARVGGTNGLCPIAARAVILATGGFQGNPDLLSRYGIPNGGSLYLRSNPWSTGDGLRAADAVGAALTPWLDSFYGHALPAPPARFGPDDFFALAQRYGPVAVALNLAGERFVDESAGTGEETLNWAVARQPGATAAYIVDAATARRAYYGFVPEVAIDRAEASGGPVVRAETLDDLCTALARWGIPAGTARRTLEGYNRALLGHPDADLHPPRKGNRYPLAEPPYTAVLVRAAITFTGGGIAVDPHMRVLRRATSSSLLPTAQAAAGELVRHAIPGLYAAGADIGGINTYGYLGGLAAALVTGRRAGRQAAAWAGAAAG
ncbi:MAG: FAD-dependent oxidoreductase [Actinomycetia bacterium]|nr:FAD-dependent oxidoreductase [Actinomycetes bacterium]